MKLLDAEALKAGRLAEAEQKKQADAAKAKFEDKDPKSTAGGLKRSVFSSAWRYFAMESRTSRAENDTPEHRNGQEQVRGRPWGPRGEGRQ